MSQIEPYLRLNGVEIANNLRTLTYLRRGLSSSAWDVALQSFAVLGLGYNDTYGDTYLADPFGPKQLACYCAAYDDGSSFNTPAKDPAPWYDAARPESGEFLGFMPISTDLNPVVARSVTRRVGGRADIGPAVPGSRLLQITGALYAGSRAGMGYGERWLSKALAGGVFAIGSVERARQVLVAGGACGSDVLTLVPYCPPANVNGFWELANVGVVSGPSFKIPHDDAGCFYQEVAIQFMAGEPWLRQTTNIGFTHLGSIDIYDDSRLTYDDALITYNGLTDLGCTTLQSAYAIADAAAVITVQSAAAVLDNVVITGRHGACPRSGVADVQYTIFDMPANSTLVIDASRETVIMTKGGTVVGGLDVVDFTGLFRWLRVAAGDSMCICIDASASTGSANSTISIDRVELQL